MRELSSTAGDRQSVRMEQVNETARLLSEEALAGPPGRAVVRYLVLDWWEVTVTASAGVPWDGPEEVSIRLAVSADTAQGAVAAAEESNGISTAVLRAIPLADSRKRLRRLRARLRGIEWTDRLSGRLDSPGAWARFARAYAQAAEHSRQPLVALEEISGLTRGTLTSRVRRARDTGLLTAPDADNLGALTRKAWQLLEADERDGT